MVSLDDKSSPEYVNGALGPKVFLPYISDLPEYAICNIVIYGNNTMLCFKCDWVSEFQPQLELASELESDPPGTSAPKKDFSVGR